MSRRRLVSHGARAGAGVILLTLAAACSSAPEATGPEATPSTGSSTTSTEAATTSSTTTSTTTTAPPTTTTTVPVVEVGDLQAGAEGPRTEALQAALEELGFDPGPVDGQFGTKTTMAVWAFQALNGLPKDGVVTADLERWIAAAPPIAMLRPDLGPTHTEVDLDKQVLLVWGDGALELVTHVSTGSGVAYCEDGHCGDAVTPVGDYRYERRIEGERRAPLGVLYNPVYFVGGIAVHGAGSVPNHPASHGCVRIPMHISAYFQSLVANGEPIGVFRGGTGAAAPVAAPDAPAQPAPEGSENGG